MCKTITCDFPKAQHRFIIGREGSGLADVMEQTGVSVEVPPEQDTTNETVLLRLFTNSKDKEQFLLFFALCKNYVGEKCVFSQTSLIRCPQYLYL